MFVSTLGFVNTFSSQGAVTKGKWELSGDTWKFYNEKNEVHKGWVETSSGWYYLDPESGEMKTGWQNINGVEYYFDSAKDGVSGHMHTGWYKSPEGKWYFFNPDQTTGGGMLTGWQWIDGYCYYFDPTPGKESGGMVAGKTTPDGFKINENGQWTDDSGKVQYVAGKGFSSNTSSGSTNTVTDTAKNKEKTASRKGKSSGHSGGGGSSGRSGQSSKPSESEKPKAPQSQEESRPSESEKPKAPQSQKESRPSESEKPKAPEKQEESRPSESKEPKAPEKQEESRPSESEKPKESQSQEESRPSESKSPKAPQSREESGPSESEKPKAPEKQEESRPSESKEPKAPQSREESKPSESKKPKESESQEESRPSESEKETEQNNAALTDGEWYGTATWSRYKLQRGSNVVKVTIKNGKIEKVDSVVYTDDGKIAGSYERKRDYLLEKFKGLEDTKGIKKQLDEGRGEVYDAVSGATETARGHLSAVDNALERSKKFKKDHKEQKIEYIEFAKRPDSVATGQTLDLSKTVLRLHLKGGEVKEITPLEFADYGIVTDPLHGSTLPSLLEFVHVHFKNADSLIDIQSEIQVRKKLGKKYPDKIKISYENGETKDIALNKDEYRYTVEAKGKIKEMSIYSGEEELGKAKYDRDLSQWRFNMKDIPHPGYDEWGYDIYAVIIDVSKDTSDIASFNLETKLIKKNYYVGDSLEIGDLEINAVTKNGNNKAFVGWEACKAGRFTSNPDNGYVFTNDDIGEKTIHISKTIDNVSVEKTFTVNVSDPKKQAPAKLEIYSGEKKITTVNVDFNKFREAQGYLKIFNVEIPKEYENWNKDTFSVKAYNDEGTLLESKVGKKYTVLTVDFKNYRAFHESGGYVWIGFKFVETAKPEQVLPATVELYDKQELIYKKTGITKQEFESSNAHLMLDVTIPKKYENKWDKDTFTVKVLDSKGTQLSHSLTKSDNILNIALSDYHSTQFGNGSIGLKFKYEGGESEDGDIKTARGEAQMETFFYKAKVLVTYNEKTGKIIKVQDDGTEPGNANNRNYWNMSVEMFEKLVGKTKDSVDTVDAVTGATLSSNAIKNAVKAALPKEAVPDATNMDVLNLVVDGNKHTYYYKKYDPTNTNMTFMVKGKDVTDKTKLVRNPYVPKVYYYVEDDQKLTGDLYGTADFPYSYFYFGELMRGRITPPSKSNDPQIGQEPVMVQSMSFDGKYTDVSSSTAKNYGKFATAVYSDKKKNSYKIRGVKTPVQIDAELYAKVKLLAAVGAENHSALIPAVTSMTAPDSITGVKREVTQNELPTYKVIHTDSSISELKSSDNASEIAYNPSDIKVSLTDQSEYGDYQIHIEGLPDEIKVDKNVLGVTFEAGASSNSARIYGLSQLDNILPNGDLGFSVNMRQKGGRLAHKRFEILSGSRIYKITYLLNNYKKFEIDGLELYIPKKLGANAVPSISSQTGFDDENGAKVIFDMSKLPYTGYKVSELYFGTKESGKKLEEGSDYSFEESSNTLTINSTDSTQKGKYTVVFEDNNKTDGYVSTSFTFDVGEASGSGDDSNIVKEVEEEITRFGYYAALRVTINKKTGTVVSVEDNDTNAGANRVFWANALNMLPRFVGKKASEIDTVDGISGATVSSDAIKKAVKKAFAEQSGFRMANRDMSMQPRLATDSNAKKPLERKKADGENDRNDLTIPSYHTERKVIMKNKVGELYDPKKLIF